MEKKVGMSHQYVQPKRALQITLWLEKLTDCEDWYNWFRERGVPVAILIKKDMRGKETFAVFRNWAGNPQMDIRRNRNLTLLDPMNGF